MVGSSGKWEPFFTAKDADKDKNNEDQQAAWAEYGKGQGLKPGKDFPRLESVDFQDGPGKGTRDGTRNVTAFFANPTTGCALSFFVNVATARSTCKGPLIKASSGGTGTRGYGNGGGTS